MTQFVQTVALGAAGVLVVIAALILIQVRGIHRQMRIQTARQMALERLLPGQPTAYAPAKAVGQNVPTRTTDRHLHAVAPYGTQDVP